VAIGNIGIAARTAKDTRTTNQLKSFIGRYFYLIMSLVIAAVVIAGFSRTVNPNLIHANPPRPLLLWIHGAAFSAWLVFFTVQSGLVRIRKVSVHRLLGWFGAALATLMLVLGCIITVVMARFDTFVLHQKDADAFMSVPFYDMLAFGTLVALAIYWRKRPEYHRRLLFMASCTLLDAGIGRFDFWFNNNLFYPFLDFLIVLGMLRDWYVDGRINKVYLYALPPMIVLQSLAVYAWRANPAWWQAITRAIL
jgi:FtsH-binding integral membrane protein